MRIESAAANLATTSDWSVLGLFGAFIGVACIMASPLAWLFFAYAGLAVDPARRWLLRVLAAGFFVIPVVFGVILIQVLSPEGFAARLTPLGFAAFLGVCPVAWFWYRKRRRLLREEAREEGRELPTARRRFDSALLREATIAKSWLDDFNTASAAELSTRGWLGQRFVAEWTASRPAGLDLLLQRRRSDRAVAQLPADVAAVARSWSETVVDRVGRLDTAHLEERLAMDAAFFERVERSPLTDEQARAVVCFDDRVRVIASAGSGKTSTLVAKAAYAVARGLVRPERVLMLTFNRATAAELQERTTARFAAVGLAGSVIRAQTFHAFGLDLIGSATGRKPSLAPWLDQGRDLEVLEQIVGMLRDKDDAFRRDWDRYRNLYADITEWEVDAQPNERPMTLSGHLVRSVGERVIADFLWTNGVEFEYEKPFVVDTADAQHTQYRPDFYYPDADLWHEHWALDSDARPPTIGFEGYEDAILWKRALHAEHGTALVETRRGDVGSPSFLSALAATLTNHGSSLEERHDRPSSRRPVPTDKDLLKQVRALMAGIKAEGLNRDELVARCRQVPSVGLQLRAVSFVDLVLRVLGEWNARLAEQGVVDFEDMTNTATQLLETGQVVAPFDLVLVDEFQDTSPARARLLRAVMQDPAQRLFVVGDDWQAINRFAGADLDAFVEFEQAFGPASTLLLQRTFRSSQAICDIAGEFVMKNPRQLSKRVHSSEEEVASAVEVWLAQSEAEQTESAARFLDELQSRMNGVRSRHGAVQRRSVRILGRYDWMRRLTPHNTGRWPDLDVRFSTIHGAKGLEADYVIVLGMSAGRHGFPSTQKDDPNLDLVRPRRDDFLDGEERRLLYVALTRARRRVVLIAEHGNVSAFVQELVHGGAVAMRGIDGGLIELCPRCGSGVLRARQTSTRKLLSCDRPRCEYSVDAGPGKRSESRRAMTKSEELARGRV